MTTSGSRRYGTGCPPEKFPADTVRAPHKFRDALIGAYAGRCAITGCSVLDILEAAHITPYLGPDTNHVTNGLLLRADLHTLFDTCLLYTSDAADE